MVQIKYYGSNSVQTATSFKILNDVAICILLNLRDKILTMKWANGGFQIERILFPYSSLALQSVTGTNNNIAHSIIKHLINPRH